MGQAQDSEPRWREGHLFPIVTGKKAEGGPAGNKPAGLLVEGQSHSCAMGSYSCDVGVRSSAECADISDTMKEAPRKILGTVGDRTDWGNSDFRTS